MKKIIAITMMIGISLYGVTQVPQAFNYQSVARGTDGTTLTDETIGVRINILTGSATGTVVYSETHTKVTNDFGLFSINIGNGSVQSGTFSSIGWGDESKFVEISILPEGTTSYQVVGTVQLLAVPYALYAGNGAGSIEINDLSDAIYDGSSLFVGQGAGTNDDGSNGNTAIGFEALYSNSMGQSNTAIGYHSLYNNIGYYNTATGREALVSNSGKGNTANGSWALNSNTTGEYNTAVGSSALYYNTTGNRNTAIGTGALHDNISGYFNIAIGEGALRSNTIGYENTATGRRALYSNTTGHYNTANGSYALVSNTEGYRNTANGSEALYYNTDGNGNSAHGYHALYKNTSGDRNTATGSNAFYNNTEGSDNTVIGCQALWHNTTGNRNTAIGNNALLYIGTGSNNIALGYNAQIPTLSGSNQVRIGNEEITDASIQVAWDITSDIQWKENIRSLPYGLDMLMKLKPVDYTRKNNEKKTREMGIIAQDLEKVLDEMDYEDQGFLTKDDNGHMHLRYNDFTALLIKSIQDQQDIIEKLEARIEVLERE